MGINFYITSLIVFLAAISCDKCEGCNKGCTAKSGKGHGHEAVTQEKATSVGHKVTKVHNFDELDEIVKKNTGVMVVFYSLGDKNCDACHKYNNKEYNEKSEVKLKTTFSDLVEKYPSFKFYKIIIKRDGDDRERIIKEVTEKHHLKAKDGVTFPIIGVYKDGVFVKFTQGEKERDSLLEELAQYVETPAEVE